MCIVALQWIGCGLGSGVVALEVDNFFSFGGRGTSPQPKEMLGLFSKTELQVAIVCFHIFWNVSCKILIVSFSFSKFCCVSQHLVKNHPYEVVSSLTFDPAVGSLRHCRNRKKCLQCKDTKKVVHLEKRSRRRRRRGRVPIPAFRLKKKKPRTSCHVKLGADSGATRASDLAVWTTWCRQQPRPLLVPFLSCVPFMTWCKQNRKKKKKIG